jgi:hypothetical protein
MIATIRKELRLTLMRLVGPMATKILYDLITQLPQGYHIEGWFMPDHKTIMANNGKLSIIVYYHLIARLIAAGLLERKRRQYNAKRGLWYKISFDRMQELIEKGE